MTNVCSSKWGLVDLVRATWQLFLVAQQKKGFNSLTKRSASVGIISLMLSDAQNNILSPSMAKTFVELLLPTRITLQLLDDAIYWVKQNESFTKQTM